MNNTASVDISQLHHVGHLVRDIQKGLDLYQRLGFHMTPPTFPTITLSDNAPATPFGVGNSHADFGDNSFVELLTVVDGHQRIPVNAILIPLQIPAAARSRVVEVISRTIMTLNGCLARFEGLHILVFGTPDADAQAQRLSQEGIGHSGVNVTRQQFPNQVDSVASVIRVIELDDPSNPVPEGRLAVAEFLKRSGSHPNGALGLIDAVLCVPEADLPAYEHRYEKYTNCQAQRTGQSSIFELGTSRVTLVADSALDSILPGERPLGVPGFVAYTVRVRDIEVTHKMLLANGFSPKTTVSGDVFVSATEALGAAVVFHPAN